MKAITIWQPWASLLACGEKIYETRSWATNYRGAIAIHAAARKVDTKNLSGATVHATVNAVRPITAKLATTSMYVPFDLLPRGAIVATAELVGCYEMHLNPVDHEIYFLDETDMAICIGEKEKYFGDWKPGHYAWKFSNMKMLDEPIHAKGGQRIWNWEVEDG